MVIPPAGTRANMTIHGGFSGPIDIGRLERESRKLLAAGFVAAIFFHAALGFLFMLRHHPPRQAARSHPERIIRTDLIEIPRLSKEPFHVTEHRFVKKTLRRPGFAPVIPGAGPSAGPPPLPETQPPDPRVDIEPETWHTSERLSDGISLDAAVPRAPDARIPLRRDAGMDPGMFRSDIIYRLKDKSAAQGFVHIPLIRSGGFIQTETYVKSLRGLAEGINRQTNIRAALDNPYEGIRWHYSRIGFPVLAEAPSERGIPLSSLLVYHPPVVYILTGRMIDFSPEEEEVVYRYLDSGGIMLVESARPGDPVLREQLRAFVQSLWYIINIDGVKIPQPLERIPGDHPLYHVFHDFPGGAPEGAGQNLGAVTQHVQPFLEAVLKNGKLIAIFSDKGYGLSWASEDYNSPAMKMGVNLILYALAQRGEKPGHRALTWE